MPKGAVSGWVLGKIASVMDFSFQGILEQHTQHMEIGFNYVFEAILKHSKLDITLIRISNVTEASFHVSLEARATNTGPAKATLAPMTIDLCGPAGRFGTITLPEFHTMPGGAYIAIQNQFVAITDKAALLSFVREVLSSKSATLSLKNGQGAVTVAAFGIGPRSLPYERDVPVPGMALTSVAVKRASTTARPSTSSSLSAFGAALSSGSTTLTVTFHVKNPSPVELSFSICEFEIRSNSHDDRADSNDSDHDGGGGGDEGVVIAALKGRLDMRSKDFDVTLYGVADKRAAALGLAEGKARLVGKRCAGAGWCDEAVKGIDVPIAGVWKLRKELGLTYEEPKPESPKVFRWRGRWFMKGSQV
ncbi:uncharacterized protein F4807DRAFT_459437 [Annulohypoxylon truncatum]|uniref:uncharacterized protein n=1 Tax=Annulohypoxylon truncatum TaxID=327061 RepID=UPI0020083520|nr:uncharacterized protein F4807DRAFT_459437 [Annulohypoxylon truncatum]KAI1210595.1 hypothetical protein F4807DRAFT_459437 [Annulohypoxylon truncatum]